MIPTRLLGARTGLQVSALALGTGRLGRDGASFDEAAARRTIQGYLDLGGNLFDTSSRYLGGRAETLIGEAVAADRDDIVIISKYGRTPRARPAAASWGQHRKSLRSEVEGTLRRLGTDYVDVLMAHTDDGVTPIEDLMYGLDTLVREGKVLYVGLSSFPAWRSATAAAIAELRGWAPLAALEMHYNLLERAPEREHVQLASARGIAMIAAAPLSGGLLTGRTPLTYTVTERMTAQHRVLLDGGPQSPEGMIPRDSQSQATIDLVRAIADESGSTPVAVAVAWVLSKGHIPAIGPRQPEHLQDNVASVDLQLDADQLRRLDRVSSRAFGFPYEMLEVDRDELGLDVSDELVGRVL